MTYKQQTLFLTVLEAGKSKIMAPSGSVLVRANFLMGGHLFTITSPSRRGKKALWNLFYKGTNSIQEGPAFRT